MENQVGEKLAALSVAGLQGETPKFVKLIYRILATVFLIWGIAQGVFPEIPEHVASVINRLGVIFLPVVYAICQTFGWKKPE